MLTLRNIRKNYGTRRVLDKVSFSLGEGQKAALVGQNGVGKSTLLKIIAGLETADRGEIVVPRRAFIGYLPQEAVAESDETLREYLRRMAGLGELEIKMAALEHELDQEERLAEYETITQEYRRLGGYDFERRSKNILEGLFLESVGKKRRVSELSGGEKRKAALAGVLLRGVDILLLDEPTNNLDFPALLWLERYLSRAEVTCLIASHDRTFLDNVVEKVIEIDWMKREAQMYTGGWSDFAAMKARALRRQKELYRIQEEEKERLLVSADQKMDWVGRVKETKGRDNDKLASNFKKERAAKKFTTSAKALEERVKRLDKIEKPFEREPLIFDVASETGEVFLDARDVVAGYHEGFAFGPFSIYIGQRDRVALLGINGAGKSTILKTLQGVLPPLSGEIHRSAGAKVGDLMQEHENIPREKTPFKIFAERLGIADSEQVLRILSRFQFSPDMASEKLEAFSPGERVRFILALLSVSGANVLVLDEPTNHLDLEAIEALEEALENYPGAIILVTHDRRFLERVHLTHNYLVSENALSPLASYETYAGSLAPEVNRVLRRLEER